MAKRNSKTPKRIRIPVSSLVQEAVDLKIICNNDREFLTGDQFDWSKINGLEKMASQCAAAEAAWQATRTDCTLITGKLKKYKKECLKLRSSLSFKLRSLAADNKFPVRIPGYSHKRAYADIVQDLHDLWWVCKEHKECLLQNGIDPSEGEKAKTASGTLAKMVAVAVNEKPSLSSDLAKRDKIRLELYTLVISIRNSCKLVFCDDPERRSRYTSYYHRAWNSKKRSKKK